MDITPAGLIENGSVGCFARFPISKSRTWVYFILLIFFHSHRLSMSIAIDNDVIGEPMIECGDSSLTFSVKTKKLFAGRIFVKGKTLEATCMRSDFIRQQTSTPTFDLSFGSCGMKGQRAPMFVTKVDRAYHVKCFFEEALRTLTAGVDVSMISTADVTAFRSSAGTCSYTIHQGTVATGVNNIGPQISVAQVGEKIVHKWECTDVMYGILVRNCYVTDGFGTQAEVIDQRGCPVDPILISAISYDSSLNQAYAESHVFKFADRPGVWFHCQVQMCLKMSQACEGLTPPSCGVMPPGMGTRETVYTSISTSAAGTESRLPGSVATTAATGGSASSGISSSPTASVPVNTTMATETTTEPAEGGSEVPSTSGLTPPASHSSSSSSSNAATGTRLSATTLSSSTVSTTGTETAVSGTGRETRRTMSTTSSELGTNPSPVPSGYEKSVDSSDKKRVLVRQQVDDDRGLVSAGPRVYVEELTYEDSGVDYRDQLRQIAFSSMNGANSIPTANGLKTTAGPREWRRPANRNASTSITSKTGTPQSTTTTSAKLRVKRKATSDAVYTSRGYQEMEKKSRRPTLVQNKRDQSQYERLIGDRAKRPVKTEEEADWENEDVFVYRDSELSNRLIIFDVDEDPPQDYLRWTQNTKLGPDLDSNIPAIEKKNVTGDSFRQVVTVSNACVVSAQGLIMILSASGALSALLILVLVITCFRYRAADLRRDNRNSAQIPPPPPPLHDSAAIRRIDQSADRIRRFNERVARRQYHHHKCASNASNSDIELPRLSHPHERRKHR